MNKEHRSTDTKKSGDSSKMSLRTHLYADVLAEWVTAEMLNWGHLPLLPTSADVHLSQNMLPILKSMPYG